MKKALIAATAAVVLAIAYIASPLVAVWSIREAMQSGNSAYLAHKLEWPTVRETLRASLLEFAAGPAPVVVHGAETQRQGVWQRLKSGISRRAVDSMVASYVTPEGLPKLFNARKFYRENISGQAAADAARPWHERASAFWKRIKRAEFLSLTAFEIEMADRNDPTRHVIGLLKLRGLEWKLTELRVRSVRTEQRTAELG